MSEAAPRRVRPRYEGDPTLAKVARSPKWIGGLLLALLVAGGFAWLGQWQLGHAIALNNVNSIDAEQVRPLSEHTEPGGPVTDAIAGYVFSTSGLFVEGDFQVIEQRRNGDQEGAWVVGHLQTGDGTDGGLAVAIGWAPNSDEANAAIESIEAEFTGVPIDVEGRYMPGDAPVIPDVSDDPTRVLSMSPAQLVNLWQPFDGGAYPGFLVMHPGAELSTTALASAGLEVVDSVPPLPVESINWLNLFYAAEWVVFAGFAIFFWFRLVRDDWERIHELQLLAVNSSTSFEE